VVVIFLCVLTQGATELNRAQTFEKTAALACGVDIGCGFGAFDPVDKLFFFSSSAS
jgi:hypothetical protein